MLFNSTLAANLKKKVKYKGMPTYHIYTLRIILSKDAFRVLSGCLSKTVHYRNRSEVPPKINIHMKNKMHIKMVKRKELENVHG